MSMFVWDEIYRVGIPMVDEQHQRLFAIANRFHGAVERGETRNALLAIFDELLDYTAYHFAEEEQKMAEIGYPDLEKHRGYHRKLVSLVETYRHQLAEGASGIEARALEFIRTWLYAHVLGTDKEVGAYAAKHNLVA